MTFSTITVAALSALTAVVAVPHANQHHQHHHKPRSSYPFNELVAFGDELSDNGNGSYAHGITGDGDGKFQYGFPTW